MFLDTLKDFIDLGGTVIVSLAALYILWQTQKNKKSNGTDKEILKEMQVMNQNHIHDICNKIDNGNKEVTKAITDMHNDLGKVLGEIKGILEK